MYALQDCVRSAIMERYFLHAPYWQTLFHFARGQAVHWSDFKSGQLSA